MKIPNSFLQFPVQRSYCTHHRIFIVFSTALIGIISVEIFLQSFAKSNAAFGFYTGSFITFINEPGKPSFIKSLYNSRRLVMITQSKQVTPSVPSEEFITSRRSRRQEQSYYKFLNEIHDYELLTPSEEYHLSLQIQSWRKLVEMRKKMIEEKRSRGENVTDNDISVQEWAHEARLSIDDMEKVVDAGVKARNKLVTANMRLVQSHVRKFARRNTQTTSLADLMQDGICGLAKAAEKFEAQRGFKFSTYATFWIKAYVKRSSWNYRLLKIPLNIHEGYEKMLGVREQLRQEKEEDSVSLDEIAMKMDLPAEKLKKYISAVGQHTSSIEKCNLVNSETDKLETRHGKRGTSASFPAVDTNKDVELKLIQKDIIEMLRGQLKKEEFEYITLRFGLKDRQPKSFQEVATIRNEKYGKVRPAIRRALGRLEKSEVANELLECLHEYF